MGSKYLGLSDRGIHTVNLNLKLKNNEQVGDFFTMQESISLKTEGSSKIVHRIRYRRGQIVSR